MANVCVGDEFEVDPEGNLTIAICGDPADATFCEGGANALRRDPDCGLYVPAVFAQEVRSQQRVVPGAVLAQGQCREGEVSFNVTNPSKCCPSTVTMFVNHYVTLNMGTGTAATIGSVTSRSQGQQNWTGAYIENEAGPDLTGADFKVTDAVSFTIAPGDTDTLWTSVLVCARRTTATERVRFVDVLHDAFGTIVTNQGECVA